MSENEPIGPIVEASVDDLMRINNNITERKIYNILEDIIYYYDILFYIILIISILLMFNILKKNSGKVKTKLYNVLLIINISLIILVKFVVAFLDTFLVDIYSIIFLIIVLMIQLTASIGLLYIPISLIRKGHDEN